MKIHQFEDIIAWKKAILLTAKVYELFKDSKDFEFRNQIQRSSISIASNIAEGFDRDTDKEFRRFLFISKGSCSEVKSLLYLAVELYMIKRNTAASLLSECDEISKIIRGLIKSLEM